MLAGATESPYGEAAGRRALSHLREARPGNAPYPVRSFSSLVGRLRDRGSVRSSDYAAILMQLACSTDTLRPHIARSLPRAADPRSPSGAARHARRASHCCCCKSAQPCRAACRRAAPRRALPACLLLNGPAAGCAAPRRREPSASSPSRQPSVSFDQRRAVHRFIFMLNLRAPRPSSNRTRDAAPAATFWPTAGGFVICHYLLL